jgi:uncharacterized membrane protein
MAELIDTSTIISVLVVALSSGTIAAFISSIFTLRKTKAEARKSQAEADKIQADVELGITEAWQKYAEASESRSSVLREELDKRLKDYEHDIDVMKNRYNNLGVKLKEVFNIIQDCPGCDGEGCPIKQRLTDLLEWRL